MSLSVCCIIIINFFWWGVTGEKKEMVNVGMKKEHIGDGITVFMCWLTMKNSTSLQACWL